MTTPSLEAFTAVFRRMAEQQAEKRNKEDGKKKLRTLLSKVYAKLKPKLVKVERGGLAYNVAELLVKMMADKHNMQKNPSSLAVSCYMSDESRTPEEIEDDTMFLAAFLFTPVGDSKSVLDDLRADLFEYENIKPDHPLYYQKHTLCQILLERVKQYINGTALKVIKWAYVLLDSNDFSTEEAESAITTAMQFAQIVGEKLNVVSNFTECNKLDNAAKVIAELVGITASYVGAVVYTDETQNS